MSLYDTLTKEVSCKRCSYSGIETKHETYATGPSCMASSYASAQTSGKVGTQALLCRWGRRRHASQKLTRTSADNATSRTIGLNPNARSVTPGLRGCHLYRCDCGSIPKAASPQHAHMRRPAVMDVAMSSSNRSMSVTVRHDATGGHGSKTMVNQYARSRARET